MRPDQEELFRRAISLARRIDFLLLREFRDGLEFAGPARGPEHGLQESDVPVDRCAFGSVLLARLDESADCGFSYTHPLSALQRLGFAVFSAGPSTFTASAAAVTKL